MNANNYQSPEFKELEMTQEGVLCESSEKTYNGSPGDYLGSDWYTDEL